LTVQSGRCSPSKSPTSSSGAGVEHGTCQSQKGGGRTRWYHRLLWICGSAVHGAAASACCTDAVLSGASGPALVKGDGHWESHSTGKNCMILTRLCKSGCLTGRCAPQSGSGPAASSLGGSTGMSGHSPRPSDRRQHLSSGVQRRWSEVSPRNGMIL